MLKLENILNYPKVYSENDNENINRAKNIFICEDVKDDLFSKLPPELQSSWIKSKELGISPSKTLSNNKDEVYQPRHSVDVIMIETFEEFYKNVLSTPQIGVKTRPYFYLVNNEGIIMIERGKPEHRKDIHSCNIGVNTDMSLSAIGTTAISIAMEERCTAQLLGSCNYLDIFKNFVSTAVPIVFENELVGVIGMLNPNINDEVMLNTNRRFNSLAYRALAIENALKMDQEQAANELIKQTINQNIGNNHAIITIDGNNRIAYICNQAKNIISFDDNSNVAHYIPHIDNTLANISNKDNKYVNKQTVKLSNNKQVQLVASRLQNHKTNETVGYSLFLFEPDNNKFTRYSLNNMIGNHKSLKMLKEQVSNVAETKHNVLIIGESGTGKEMVAQAIHEASGVKGPFVAINCASIPANLIESELFGYVEGAFTGAAKSGSVGKIEYANNGTLFLDEIGDMPLSLQPVLLRVLEERQVTKIGAKKATSVNVRVVAATNVNLYEKVLKGEFRQDLYFRLSVINVNVPPLRERGKDVLLLAQHFIAKECLNKDKQITMSDATEMALLNYEWPGNIRQLENAVISSIYSLYGENVINPHHLPLIIKGEQVGKQSDSPLNEIVQETIVQALRENNGNCAKTARMLKISRMTLYNKMKAFGIKS